MGTPVADTWPKFCSGLIVEASLQKVFVLMITHLIEAATQRLKDLGRVVFEFEIAHSVRRREIGALLRHALVSGRYRGLGRQSTG